MEAGSPTSFMSPMDIAESIELCWVDLAKLCNYCSTPAWAGIGPGEFSPLATSASGSVLHLHWYPFVGCQQRQRDLAPFHLHPALKGCSEHLALGGLSPAYVPGTTELKHLLQHLQLPSKCCPWGRAWAAAWLSAQEKGEALLLPNELDQSAEHADTKLMFRAPALLCCWKQAERRVRMRADPGFPEIPGCSAVPLYLLTPKRAPAAPVTHCSRGRHVFKCTDLCKPLREQKAEGGTES
ncbi:hypothetical protein DV515_00001744 [Chloebia gouldiae]|uniref:Uncharacterized protein n=1 Tax=Chloebia gouldiae TaxID=44316 RepID=A0A3L8SYX7_CHLGU|nr:hypothetical protein DV515_00001744 [Chloebia gouldiae]